MQHHRSIRISSAILMLAAVVCSSADASIRGELTPEERVLYAQQAHGAQWRSLNTAQRCARMEQVRGQWRSMSLAARNQLKQQLAARWQTLPPAEKQSIEQRVAARQARRAQNRGPRNGARCASAKGSGL